jgi:glycosyltransferase involved in cell wall biosynthesis
MAQGYPVAGGHEAHILHYATEMRNHGFDTKAVVPDPLPRQPHRFMTELGRRGISLESVADAARWRTALDVLARSLPWLVRHGTDLAPLRAWIRARAVAVVLREKLVAERPDLVHVFGRLADNLWSVLPASRCAFHHGTSGLRDETWTDAEAERFRAFCERAALNFAPGLGVVVNVRRAFGVQREIVPVFTICPDQRAAAETPAPGGHAVGGGPRFGILCRFIEEKGIRPLLEALTAFRARRGALDFTFAGEGPLEGDIRHAIATGSLGDCVRLLRVRHPADVLESLDVFVHPSLSDAMPMAVAEALMCGKPCIVTRVGGLADLVRDGEEGLLIDAGSAAAIVAAMERFADMPAPVRAAFGVRARSRYEAVCRPDAVGAFVAAHYRRALSLAA